VSDGGGDHYLYELKLGKGRKFNTKKGVDLTKLDGTRTYLEALSRLALVKPDDRRLDLEGLAVCGDAVYVVNERVRQVLVVDLAARKLEMAPIDFGAGDPEGAARLFQGGGNAGFEGVAADCAGKVLYVAKEREPRYIVKVDLATWKVLGSFDLAPSDRDGQKVINPFTGDGLMALNPDFADLAFDGGFLYVLERNTAEIAKVDPASGQVVARVSYYKTERAPLLYETGEPFGVAEALLLDKDRIWIGFDNNGQPVGGKTAKAYDVKGHPPALAAFKRPAGF
jgi:uncharacterized protein YjiK